MGTPPGEDGRILPHQDDLSIPAGLVIKKSFWIWSEKNISGNTIDFFMKIEGKTFQQAMQIIQGRSDYDSSERKIREECGNTVKTVR